ncbi:MAG TPA: glycosyl hydrolase [Thermoanaerobaculia bacterium]|nr:glycosyl hydrolase [Thermoanaerobaculia bacterium]
MGRRIVRIVLPVMVIILLVATYPAFERLFTGGLSYLRVSLARLELSIGLREDAGTFLLGAYSPEAPYTMEGVVRMETAMEHRLDIIAIYQTWGDRPEDEFPLALMRAIDEQHRIGMITWEPWTSAFRRNAGRAETARLTRLREIADGHYDAYIRGWAREAVIFGRPFFLRFAHEMNNPQYPWSLQAGNTPADFVDAWRHVWRIFHQEGARNVIWTWSPQNRFVAELYPGGEYVDWIATGVFNYGVYGDGVWYSFEFLYETFYREAITYEKPLMIAELGCSPFGGDQVAWYADAFEKLRSRYPRTDAVVFYGNPADTTTPGAVIDWTIGDNPALLEMLRRALPREPAAQ